MNLLRAWNRFWFAPTSARPLGALRILFGVIVLLHLGLLAGDADEWLSNAGRVRNSEARELAGPLRPSLLLWADSPNVVHAAMAITTIATILFTLGWHTRVMGIVVYAMLLSIHHRNMLTLSGADTLVIVVAFCLMISPCGEAISLDHRRKMRKLGAVYEPLILPWAHRLIQIQVSVVYFMTALLKANGGVWHDGTALYYVLNNTEFRRFTLGLTSYPALINALTYGTVLLEFSLAFLLWVKAARPWMIAAGLSLHAGILLTVNIPVFGELITACYLTFLLPDEFNRLCRCLDPRRLFSAQGNAVVVRRPHVLSARVRSKASRI